MRKILVIFTLVTIMISNITGNELGQYEYPCHFLKDPPVIDGKEEKVWDNAPWKNGFLVYTGGSGARGYALEKPSSFKAGWTKDSVYLLIKCYDSEPDKLDTGKTGSLWSKNSIEILFSPRSGNHFLQMLTTSSGSKWSGISGTRETELAWDVKTALFANGWIAEMRIPLKTLDHIPSEDKRWSVNIARNSITGTTIERYTCWPPLENGFHDVGNFGKFVFREKEADISEEETGLNTKYKKFISEKAKEICSEYSDAKMTIETGIKYQNLRKDVKLLKEGWKDAELLLAEKTPSIEMITLFLMKRKNLKAVTEEFKYKIQLEILLAEYSGDAGR